MITWDPTDRDVCADPHPHYRQLRDEAPVFRHPKYAPWFLSRFDDVTKVLLDLEAHTVTEGTTSMQLLFKEQEAHPLEAAQDAIEISAIAMLDPPLHTRVRGQLNAPFKPGAAAQLDPLAREIVRERLQLGRERGGLDACADLAGYLSVRIVCTILGLPLEDADRYSGWINQLFDHEAMRGRMTGFEESASAQLHMHLIERVGFWRKHDTRLGGLADVLLYDDFEGRRLNDLEVAFHLSLFLIGGTETFPKVASAAIHRLWQHPDQRAAVVADPKLAAHAFHEALRFDMPTQMLGRTVVREMEIHGQRIQPGERLMFLWAAANRDERQFERADEFDIGRGTPRILSFGYGAHMCLGMHVAKMEGRALLQELLAAQPDYTVDEDAATRLDNEFFRGFRSLPIGFGG